MRIPIAYTLAWPERMQTPSERLSLTDIGRLDFEAPDPERFPALRLARHALDAGGGAPVVLNAANEIAVESFLANRIGFCDISCIVEQALDEIHPASPQSVAEVVALDAEVREYARSLVVESCC